jgi:hypothetical protein
LDTWDLHLDVMRRWQDAPDHIYAQRWDYILLYAAGARPLDHDAWEDFATGRVRLTRRQARRFWAAVRAPWAVVALRAHKLMDEWQRAGRDRRRTFTPKQKAALWERANGACHYCAAPLGDDWEADHVVPWSRGGQTVLANGVASCPTCNRRKSDRLLEVEA